MHIVGGGPAGLMLGLLLAKRGADVLVLEGHENFDREFRGEVLQPSTAHLLDEIGLLEYVRLSRTRCLNPGKVRLNGKDVGEFFFKKISPEYPYAIWMPQPVFLSALHKKASTLPSFQCWMGAKVSKLMEEDGCIVGVSGNSDMAASPSKYAPTSLSRRTGVTRQWRRWEVQARVRVS